MRKVLDARWRQIRHAAEKIFCARLRAVADGSVTEGGWLSKRAEDYGGDGDAGAYEADDLETYNQNEADDYRHELDDAGEDSHTDEDVTAIVLGAVANTRYQSIVSDLIASHGIRAAATGLFYFCEDWNNGSDTQEYAILSRLIGTYHPGTRPVSGTRANAVYEALMHYLGDIGQQDDDQFSDDPTENSK